MLLVQFKGERLGELELDSKLYHKQQRLRWVLSNEATCKAGGKERGIGADGCLSSS